MGEKGKCFLTEEFQLINTEGMREIESHGNNRYRPDPARDTQISRSLWLECLSPGGWRVSPVIYLSLLTTVWSTVEPCLPSTITLAPTLLFFLALHSEDVTGFVLGYLVINRHSLNRITHHFGRSRSIQCLHWTAKTILAEHTKEPIKGERGCWVIIVSIS